MPGRCFLSIGLPKPVVARLQLTARTFRDASPAWRDEKWVAPALLHVTLAFLGPVPDEDVGALLDRLRETGDRRMPFTLHLSGARAVPTMHRTAMIWALLDGDVQEASSLRDDVLATAGCRPDPRPFRPHVTLVRSRRPRRVHHDPLAALEATLMESGKAPDGLVSVPSFTVVASTLGVAGPTYRTLGVVALKGHT
jgi:2'-5' RNA ligase